MDWYRFTYQRVNRISHLADHMQIAKNEKYEWLPYERTKLAIMNLESMDDDRQEENALREWIDDDLVVSDFDIGMVEIYGDLTSVLNSNVKSERII